MEINSSPKSHLELISPSNNVLTMCRSSSSVVLMRSESGGSSLPLPIGEAGSGGVQDGGLAAAASEEEEQGKEVDIVPAAPDAERKQERHVMPHQNNRMQQLGALEMKARSLREKISKLLGPASRHRAVTRDSLWRCLAFMETEIRFIVVFLTTLKSSNLQHFDGNWYTWVVRFCEGFLSTANNVFHDIDPSRHTVQRGAAQSSLCYTFRRIIKNLYISIGSPFRYPHLVLTSSDLGLTPQLPEAGALPLVGIDRPAKKILRWLRHQGKMDRSQLRVVCIVGHVGIGKTTLTVELRNRLRHETVGGRYYFQCNVMVQVSRGIDRNILLLQDILSQVSEPTATALSSDPPQAETTEVLVHLISECLQDKRYFIIIDNICQESDWEEIKGAFPNTNNGSGILITTRVTSIAEACCSGSYYGLVHEMKPLSEMDSERLLLAKAVSPADGCLPNSLKLICGEILGRCDGIPLFLTAMADWLKEQGLQQQQRQREDGDEEHQSAIHCEEEIPRLPERLEQALSSAFNDLPYGDLRSLSLYMSMFRYGYKFDKDRLISQWIQEGHLFWSLHNMVDMDRSKVTSIAETFFSQLVDRNVITCVASNCKHKQDEAEACRWQVNHFMHQFLVSKSAEMGFVFTTATLKLFAAPASPATGHGNKPSSRIPQRLALHHQDPLLPSLFETMDLLQTRSLAVSGEVSGITLKKFANLVVLDFEGWKNLKDKDLLQVCKSKMFFLTYLNIRNTQVRKLPKEIKELRILETLDISYTQITELPLQVFELIFLRHLDLRGTRINQLPKQIVGIRDIPHHPVGGEGVINSVETETRPPRIHRLATLATVYLTEHSAIFIKVLGYANSLRVLVFTWSFHQSTDRECREALLSSIGNWADLESLTIHCGLGCYMEFPENSPAPRKLENFNVTAGRFASVPQLIHGLQHLSFVRITVCNMQTTTNDLKILGALPALQCLLLGLDFIPGQAIVIENQGFSKLQRFSLDCILPWLTFQTGAMPRLTHLQLKFSSGSASEDRVPSGIRNLARISQVALSYSKWCANSTTVKMAVKAVREQVAKHCNLIDLFINGVEDYVVQTVDEEAENATGTSSSRTDSELGRDDAQAVDKEASGVAQTEITEAEN